jgi:hypothetical protein
MNDTKTEFMNASSLNGFLELLKLIFAGVLVTFGIFAGVVFIGPPDPCSMWEGMVYLLFIFVWMGLVLFAVMAIFNGRSVLTLGYKTHAQYIRELEEKGLLELEQFRAKRCFQVEEYEDEGLHYFIELEDGTVLFVSGQYLYEYDPDPDDAISTRTFPCDYFTLRSHKQNGHVIDILCHGVPTDPELVVDSLNWNQYSSSDMLHDGKIIADRSYAEIRNELSKESK